MMEITPKYVIVFLFYIGCAYSCSICIINNESSCEGCPNNSFRSPSSITTSPFSCPCNTGYYNVVNQESCN